MLFSPSLHENYFLKVMLTVGKAHFRRSTVRAPIWFETPTLRVFNSVEFSRPRRTSLLTRRLPISRTMASAASAQSVMEINVPTPWGHLATKCWNFPSDRDVAASNPRELVSSSPVSPVVCLHGWQDNAGSFDALIPLLDRDIPFICVDFTGHGRSSGRPAGTTGDIATSVLDVKRIFDYFGIESGGSLMGHSMGGAVSVCFAATFPGIILKCLTFDAPAMFPR